jgi:CRISPR-associated endonuclease Csy4
MNHYLDLHLQPDPEFPAFQLMNALYAKLHRALVSINSSQIGVSFPQHLIASNSKEKTHLGACLRLHGTPDHLQKLMQENWLQGMRDHIALKESMPTPTPVPPHVKHRVIRRVQPQSHPERMRRRARQRHNLSAEQAYQRIPDFSREKLKLPFIELKSASTNQLFRIFIEHASPQPLAAAGSFNTYGLSQTATLPWF